MSEIGQDPARRDRRRLRMRRAIMDAGQQLFAERAMEGVTIDEIVDVADISKGSFYNHFDDKQQLATAIVELIQGDLEFHVMAANRIVADPAERITRALGVVLRYALDHPERVQAVLSLSERKTAADTPLNAGVAADLQAGLAQGRFSGVSLETGVLLVVGTFVITLRHITLFRPATPVPELAVTMAAALLRALGVSAEECQPVASHVTDTLGSQPIDQRSEPPSGDAGEGFGSGPQATAQETPPPA